MPVKPDTEQGNWKVERHRNSAIYDVHEAACAAREKLTKTEILYML